MPEIMDISETLDWNDIAALMEENTKTHERIAALEALVVEADPLVSGAMDPRDSSFQGVDPKEAASYQTRQRAWLARARADEGVATFHEKWMPREAYSEASSAFGVETSKLEAERDRLREALLSETVTRITDLEAHDDDHCDGPDRLNASTCLECQQTSRVRALLDGPPLKVGDKVINTSDVGREKYSVGEVLNVGTTGHKREGLILIQWPDSAGEYVKPMWDDPKCYVLADKAPQFVAGRVESRALHIDPADDYVVLDKKEDPA